MKPKINDKVWTIYDYQILLERVEYIGEDSFLIEDYDSKLDPCYCYTDYNKTWFKDLEKAKKEMRKRFGKDTKIEKYDDECWEVVDDDE